MKYTLNLFLTFTIINSACADQSISVPASASDQPAVLVSSTPELESTTPAAPLLDPILTEEPALPDILINELINEQTNKKFVKKFNHAFNKLSSKKKKRRRLAHYILTLHQENQITKQACFDKIQKKYGPAIQKKLNKKNKKNFKKKIKKERRAKR